MNFATFDFVLLKDLVKYLKNSLKSKMNTEIIRLYRSFLVQAKYQNDIAINI